MDNSKKSNMYDIAIIGGGVSGCAAAWCAAKLGMKVILIEKKSYLGGAITGGLVLPIMKTDDKNINNLFYKELIANAKNYGAQITYIDGNDGWLNPELLKIVLDNMLVSAGVEILFNSDIDNISTSDNQSLFKNIFKIKKKKKSVDTTHNDKSIKFIKIKRNILSYYVDKTYNDKTNTSENKKLFKNSSKLFLNIYANYFIDASGDAIISELLNLSMQNDNDLRQAETLRFIMSGVNSGVFAKWLLEKDPDRNVTNVAGNNFNEFFFTTAYTWDKDKHWGLEPIFKEAIKNGDLTEEDTSYFQIFGIAKMPGAVAFNCPRVNQNQKYENKLINARKAIFRIAKFCIKYFKGFENAYISQISDELGVRVSNRPCAVYNYSVSDILHQKKFKHVALHSDYPIDIHSEKKNEYVLDKTKGYDLPVEALISSEYKNLFNIGKSIGADFKSQAALRVQKSCFSMGEAVAKYIKGLENANKSK